MALTLLDLETAPLPGVDELLPDFKPRGNIKDADKQAASVAEKRDKAIADAALDPDLCRIVYLGAWFDGQPTPCLSRCEDEEEEYFVLRGFWESYKRGDVLLGYNLLKFDLPILMRRSLYLGIEAPALHRGRYRHDDVCDLWSLLSEDGALPWRSLDYYHKRLGFQPFVDDITGADVPGCVARGEWDKVRNHLMFDLLRTRDVATRMGVLAREAVSA